MVLQPIVPYLFIILITFIISVIMGYILTSTYHNKSLFKKWVLRSVILLLIPVMLLRPGVIEKNETEIYASQFDIFFVVDTTSSMIAEDWEKNSSSTRLSGVKSDITRLVDEYSGSRYSLITFNKEAYIQAPLTRDASAVMSSVSNILPEITRNSQGSDVRVSAKLLERTLQEAAEKYPDRARLVFFFSDGEETAENVTSDKNFSNISSLVSGGSVYGYGTDKGGKMLTQSGYFISKESSYIQDPSTGKDALSKIDEKNLKAIASELNIPYQHRSSSEPIEIDKIDMVLTPDIVNAEKVTDYTWILAAIFGLLMAFNLGLIFVSLSKVRVKD